MKVLDLARLLLEQAPHHFVAVEIDGFDCTPVHVRRQSGFVEHEVVIEVDPPEGYRLLPDEPTADMIEACDSLGYSEAALSLMWATMIRAHDAENE